MRNKESICQYCTRQRAKSTLALMLIEIELAKYNANLLQARSTSKYKQEEQEVECSANLIHKQEVRVNRSKNCSY